VFDKTCKFVRKFGKGSGRQWHPRGLAFDPHGNLFVCSELGDCVQVFSPDGTLLWSFGAVAKDDVRKDDVGKDNVGKDDVGRDDVRKDDVGLSRPTGIWVDCASRVYVCDSGKQRVCVFVT
jgi:hypothetical protein